MKQTIETLFTDHEFFAALVNGPCKPWSSYSQTVAEAIDPSWIDDEHSAIVTQALLDFMKDSFPFFTTVKAIIPPEVSYDDLLTEPDASRPRYIFVTVLDDSNGTYHFNSSVFHQIALGYLIIREIYRTSTIASDMNVGLSVSEESPLSLNQARIEWVTLDVTTDYIHEISDQYFKMNRYVLPEIDDPVVQKILEVYRPPDPISQ